MSAVYDVDFIEWLDEQARLLRARQFTALDFDNLAEEIEALSRSQRREFKSRFTVLLMHLLKWHYQPEFRCNNWKSILYQQRSEIEAHIDDMPSILNEFQNQDWQINAWKRAVEDVSEETGVFLQNFPDSCPWTTDQVLSDWFPPD
jgi:hypothetical protein